MSYLWRRGHREKEHICHQSEELRVVDFDSCLEEREPIYLVRAGHWRLVSLSVPCVYEGFLPFRHYIVKRFMLGL